MSELSCGTRFIGRNETLDLSLASSTSFSVRLALFAIQSYAYAYGKMD